MFYEENEVEQALVSEINMVPFIDIMLVLLVVFMVTIPVITSQLNIDLPKGKGFQSAQQPEAMQLFLTADGQIAINEKILGGIQDPSLINALKEIALRKRQPHIHLSADKATDYELVLNLLMTANKLGIKGMGFVFEEVERE